MALSATLVPATRARPAHSTSSDRRIGAKLVTAFALARLSLLVLWGRAPVEAACPGSDRDHTHCTRTVGRRVGAAPDALDDDSGTASTPTAQDPADRRRDTTSTTLVMAGAIGLLGVAGAAALVVDSITGPVRRAVRALQAPAQGRPDQRLRLITPDELPALEAPIESGSVSGVVRVEHPVHETAPAQTTTATRTPSALSVATARYAAARGRAYGPTTALWHAVELDRLAGAVEGACETTVCGSLVRLGTDQAWPVAARGVCPACAILAS